MCFDCLTDEVISQPRLAWKVFSINPENGKLQSAFDNYITNSEGLYYEADRTIEYVNSSHSAFGTGIYSFRHKSCADWVANNELGDWCLYEDRKIVVRPIIIFGEIITGYLDLEEIYSLEPEIFEDYSFLPRHMEGFYSSHIYIPSNFNPDPNWVD